MATTNQIECPKCGELMSIDDALMRQIEQKVKKGFENSQKIKEVEIAKQKQELQIKEQQLLERQKSVEVEINKKTAEKINIEKVALWKKALAEADKNRAAETKLLEEQLRQKDVKLQEATTRELEIRREKNQLEEDKRSFELEKQRQLDDERKKIEEEANKKAVEAEHYKMAQLEKKLSDALKVNADQKRKLEQGSQQAQGEVLELELEELLKQKFPQDEITPVAKGIGGADVIQKVIDSFGHVCGQIVWESKETKAWSEGWIQKLKDDQRQIKADLAVIISAVLPPDIKGFGLRGEVFICDIKLAMNLASLLRYDLIKVAESSRALEGKDEKRDVVYAYVNSVEFKQRIQAIAEAFIFMKEDLEKEKRVYQNIWAKRDKQIQRVVDNTFGMYGDLKGLTGGTIQEIKLLELEEGDESE